MQIVSRILDGEPLLLNSWYDALSNQPVGYSLSDPCVMAHNFPDGLFCLFKNLFKFPICSTLFKNVEIYDMKNNRRFYKNDQILLNKSSEFLKRFSLMKCNKKKFNSNQLCGLLIYCLGAGTFEMEVCTILDTCYKIK